MNVKEAIAYVANEGIWVVLGWVVIGMFLFTMALMVISVVAMILF